MFEFDRFAELKRRTELVVGHDIHPDTVALMIISSKEVGMRLLSYMKEIMKEKCKKKNRANRRRIRTLVLT